MTRQQPAREYYIRDNGMTAASSQQREYHRGHLRKSALWTATRVLHRTGTTVTPHVTAAPTLAVSPLTRQYRRDVRDTPCLPYFYHLVTLWDVGQSHLGHSIGASVGKKRDAQTHARTDFLFQMAPHRFPPNFPLHTDTPGAGRSSRCEQ